MIGRIKGILLESNPPQIVVDVHGVGYEIDVPMSTFYNLPALGQEVTLLTHMLVREDAQLLYGFLTREERETFRQLLKVSGIGARTALAVLSGLSVGELVNAVAMQDANMLTRVPGIGKKTAERLILELKDKLTATLGNASVVAAVDNTLSDIINALIGLGYSDREARNAAKKLPEGVSVSDGIRMALQNIVK
ncbi:MAG TPA: Holliday junction branch migration protein RuvA [Candidatus Aphodousia gallistercoris]|nr:Holliday junction branch migration protein RuvA [Candidatus Aphodousia gallistercoris]